MGTIVSQKEAYESALKNEWKEMVDFYESRISITAPVTVARDTVLHVAVESLKAYPLDELIRIWEDVFVCDIELGYDINPVFEVNVFGNTVLHQAATVGNYEAVELLADRFPMLAEKTNKIGETALFRAALFGHTKIVDYLANKVEGQTEADGKLLSVHRSRSNGTSILHAAVQGEQFETALFLLNIDESLGSLSGKDGKTALHLLANMPSAFESGYKMAVLKKLLYSCLPVEEYKPLSSVETARAKRRQISIYLNINEGAKRIHLSICKFLFNGWPTMKRIWEDKKKHKFARLLANKLIVKDLSWEMFVEGNYSSSSGFEIRLSYDPLDEQRQKEQENTGYEEKEGRESENPHQKIIKEYEETKEDNQTEEKEEDKETKAEIQEVKEKEEKEKKRGHDDIMPNQSSPSQFLKFDTQQVDHHNMPNGNQYKEKIVEYVPIPLFIATENGIIEIVQFTLQYYPQAVEHIDGNGRNILHLAISHRRKEIFEYLVKQMRKPVARLKLWIDNDGYTLLHHAADTEHYVGGSKLGPALQLQEELQWFEKVQELVPSHYALHREKKEAKKNGINSHTALELLKKKHIGQLEDAHEWVKETSESCSTIAVLVATVVFAAVYNVPGGSNDEGVPNLSKSPSFLFFTIMDIISLACSLTSVVMFLSVLTSPFELQEFRHSLPRKLTFGLTFLFFSVVTTMLTFGATLLLIIHSEQKLTKSVLSVAAFFPVLVFALMQFRLYVAFAGSIKELVNDIANTFPSCFLPFLCCKDKHD